MNGDIENAETMLDDARALMQEISEQYADFQHYPNLKGYYATVTAYLDAVTNFKMSFDEYTENYIAYKKAARDYESDLEFLFGD